VVARIERTDGSSRSISILSLQEYDFEIKHRPDRQHSNADALSRFPLVTSLRIPDQSVDEDLMFGVNGTEVCTSWSKTEILKAQQDDPSISMIMQKLCCSDDLPEDGNDHDNSRENGDSLGPVYEFVCISFRTDNLDCFRAS
jgi:hypothetical protein